MGSACSVWTTLGLLLLTACVLSRSTLLRFQVVLQGNCLRRVLGCVHFPGLQHSGSASQVLNKGTDSFGPAFCALPRSEQLRQPGAWRVYSSQLGNASYHLPGPSCSVSWVHSGGAVSGVPCVSSGAWSLAATLLMDVNCPGSQQDLVSNCESAHSLVGDAVSGAEFVPCLLAGAVARLPPCLQRWGGAWTQSASFPLVFCSILCSVSRPG